MNKEGLNINNIKPDVSVIIPIYNVERYLRQCLDSVITQTLKNIEIICINDGSPDNSQGIIIEYKQKDSRIIVISRENRGVAVSRNEGINIASGEFVIFMDPDDYYPSEKSLKDLYIRARENNALICGGSLAVLNGDGTITFPDGKRKFTEEGFIDYGNYQYSFFYQRFIFDREMLIKNNIYFPKYIRYQDPVFMIKAMIEAGKFYAIKSYTYCYRIDFKTNADKNSGDAFKAIKDCLVLSKENNLAELHTFTATTIINEQYLFSNNLELYELLFEVLLTIDYNLLEQEMKKSFIRYTLNFFGQNDAEYSKHIDNIDNLPSVLRAFKKSLSSYGLYPQLKDIFNALASKAYGNVLTRM